MRWAAMYRRLLDRMAARLLAMDGVDFTQPRGEPALLPPDAVSWRVFANPVTMYVGGIAAVLLELGEPRVRHGVWDHSQFRLDPARRLRRTGMAAMVTVYGARSQFEALAARVNRMHAGVRGVTPAGERYAADDPVLLRWVQATAAWAFAEAYHRHACRLSPGERDTYFAEGRAGAALYRVSDPPASAAAVDALFAAMAPRLEPSPILGELLDIVRTAPILPGPLLPLQRLGVKAAIDLLPPGLRSAIGLAGVPRPGLAERALLRVLAQAAERAELPSSARARALRRIAARSDAVTPDPVFT